ncbi:MAG: TetR/AcrR family transcriptional regulator [Desulfobacterales bacterium]|nr:TetR/AcrR family transcriptional regulator [Desulfobacterales bacterium]
MKEQPMAVSRNSVKRKRGRPPKLSLQKMPIERAILEAAKQVCADYGVQALTVELILQQSGVSRPTFYKYFKNKEIVLEMVCRKVNGQLVEAMRTALLENRSGVLDPGSVSAAIVDTYLNWGMTQGAIIGRFYQVRSDEASALSRHREETVAKIIEIMQQVIRRAGFSAQDPLLLKSLIGLVEHLGSTLFSKQHSAEEVGRVRGIMCMILEKFIMHHDATLLGE